MDQIGTILKQRREELQLSLTDMSNKTKLSVVQLEAIEQGDIEYFKNDLSYLNYFVRYYANALGLDYNQIRDNLDDIINSYTASLSLTQAQKREAINENIRKKAKVKHASTTRRKRKADLSLILFFAAIAAILILLTYIGIYHVWPMISNLPTNPPVVVNPPDEDPNEDPNAEEPGEEDPGDSTPEGSSVEVRMANANLYEIHNWKSDTAVVIDLLFNHDTWISVAVDGVAPPTPASRTYRLDESAKLIIENPQENTVVQFVLGYVQGNQFLVDGTAVALDGTVAQLTGRAVVEFVFKGETP